MKKTALYEIHKALGAKLVPFAGYQMPVQFEGVNAEHLTVRKGVGVFDVSHMGEFLIEGPNALALIQSVTSNDASVLSIGKAQYSCLPNDKGGIVDDLIIYRLEENAYLLVVNASNIEKDWQWISANNDVGAKLTNISDDYSLLAIQGPMAIEAMQILSSVDFPQPDGPSRAAIWPSANEKERSSRIKRLPKETFRCEISSELIFRLLCFRG